MGILNIVKVGIMSMCFGMIFLFLRYNIVSVYKDILAPIDITHQHTYITEKILKYENRNIDLKHILC